MRYNNIEIVMTVKKRITAGETEFRSFSNHGHINTVYERVNEAIEKIKTEEDSSTDKVNPRKAPPPCSAQPYAFDWLDHGWLPMS